MIQGHPYRWQVIPVWAHCALCGAEMAGEARLESRPGHVQMVCTSHPLSPSITHPREPLSLRTRPLADALELLRSGEARP